MSAEKAIVEDKQKLKEMITKDMSMIEKTLTVIRNDIPINGKTAEMLTLLGE